MMLDSWSKLERSAVLRRIGLAVALLLFLGGTIWSLNANPGLLLRANLWPLALIAVVGTPLIFAGNAFELRLMAAFIGVRMSWRQALETTILGSAANMLPLPGGALARVAALYRSGAPATKSVLVNIVFASIWVALGFTIAGVCLLILERHVEGWIFIVLGGMAGTLWIISGLRHKTSGRLLILTLFNRSGLVLLDAIVSFWALYSLDSGTSLVQATVFGIASILGSAVSIVPAGLGIREGVSALLAPMAGYDPATAFLAVVLSRLAVLTCLMPTTCIFLVLKK